jgi:hypothetical protein
MGTRVEASAEIHAQGAASAQARRWIQRAARESGVLLSDLRLRLSAPDPAGGRVLAQATAHADGRAVRVQVLAPTLAQAVEALCGRTGSRLRETSRAWRPRTRPEPDRPAPEPVAGLEPKIARIKKCPLTVCAAEVAAAHMDAMDYDAHLFIDRESGQTCAVRASGPTGYHLAWLRPTIPPRHPRPPLVIDPYPAPVLGATAAAQRLHDTGDAHLLFAEPTTGRCYLIYRRYDGHYTLLTGDPTAQASAADDVYHEAALRVLAGVGG